MIRHLIKINWNQKGRNSLLLIEIFISFLILFAIFSIAIQNISKYRTPLGFEYKNIWVLRPEYNRTNGIDKTLQQVQNVLKNFPEITAVTTSSGNIPYTSNARMSQFEYGSRKIQPQQFAVDDGFMDVMGLKIAEGRWFDESDNSSQYVATVINREVQRQLFPDENPLGKVMTSGRTEYKICGIIEQFRYRGEFYKDEPSLFERTPITQPNAQPNCFLIKVQSGTNIQFEEQLNQQLAAVAHGWTWNIEHLSKMRSDYFLWSLIPLILLAVVCGFLILNVALGLFGVLWNNISQRRSEIAVRRAVGAWSQKIYQQITGEMLVLATFGILLGTIFAVQFPLLNVFNVSTATYILALLFAALTIYLFVLACTLFPSYLATKIQPAMALHEE